MDTLAYLVDRSDNKFTISLEETSVGRLNTNTIQINDPTVSKSHAIISYLKNEGKFYLKDLDTVNGTYINGERLDANKKVELKHKDSVQFGKHEQLHIFMRSNANEKKGKVNLKDYCAELEDQDDRQPNQKKMTTHEERKVTPVQKTSSLTKINQDKFKNNKIKIPEIADYLEIEQSFASSIDMANSAQKSVDESRPQNKSISTRKQKRVELPSIGIMTEKQRHQYSDRERETNLFILEQRQKEQQQQEHRLLQNQKIKLELEKAQQEEKLFKKKIQLEITLREEQQKLAQDKQRIEETLLQNERIRREKNSKQQQELKRRQQSLVEQLYKEKQLELQSIRQQEQQTRLSSEQNMRKDFEARKKELEKQAEAFTKQYEQIYRQAFNKIKIDISKEQEGIEQLVADNQKMGSKHSQLAENIKEVQDNVNQLRNDYMSITGRNKAFILYASELQNKIDRLAGVGKQTKALSKIKEQIMSSRKLLSMKHRENQLLEEEIHRLRLNVSSRDSSNYLETVFENHSAIESSKQLYYEQIEKQKALEEIWSAGLSQNQRLAQRNKSVVKEIQQLRKQFIDNCRDNNHKAMEQRLHLLKCLHYVGEEKKRAAKFLIEEIMRHEEETKELLFDCEKNHEGIHKAIVEAQQLKDQNTYYSQILFGADSSAHHFDNMKIEISQLIERVQLEKSPGSVHENLRELAEIEQLELNTHELTDRIGRAKQKMRENVSSQQIVMPDKNPVVFFGDLLCKKQSEIEQSLHSIAKLEKQHEELQRELATLNGRKKQLEESMEKFKREELLKVRKSIM